MQVVQSHCQVSSELLDCILREILVLFDDLIQIATGAVLEDDPEMVPSLIPVVEFEHVPVLEVVEDSNLINRYHVLAIPRLRLSFF